MFLRPFDPALSVSLFVTGDVCGGRRINSQRRICLHYVAKHRSTTIEII